MELAGWGVGEVWSSLRLPPIAHQEIREVKGRVVVMGATVRDDCTHTYYGYKLCAEAMLGFANLYDGLRKSTLHLKLK